MFGRFLFLASAAALGTSAMFVVPESPMKVHPIVFEGIRHAVVDLPCTKCPFRCTDEEGAVSWANDKSSTLTLHISIEDNYLLVNSRRVFPYVPSRPINAFQQLEDDQDSSLILVGYALEVVHLGSPFDTPDTELLDVRFTVVKVENRPVRVDTLAITLIQDPAGKFYIAKTEIGKPAPPERLFSNKSHDKLMCFHGLLLPQIRNLLAAARGRVIGMSPGIASRMDFRGKTKYDDESESDESGHMDSKPHYYQDDRFRLDATHSLSHDHCIHQKSLLDDIVRTFSLIMRFMVVPAILGVLGGITACAFGSFVIGAARSFWLRSCGSNAAHSRKCELADDTRDRSSSNVCCG